jgi:PQQ-dependent dehydrogenase (methanol/ethanol family)
MHARAIRFALVALAVAAGSVSLPAQYSLTVNKDRLINAQNEPQNWLLMNGDYGSLRYSKLTQINRENVKNLRMVWAMALGGMQDVGQNGPENELNPLIDNGFMYTSDGWGTIYKIDARNPGRGSFAWIADPGVQHEGNTTRTRGIALWEDKVIANLPDGRVIAVNRENGEIVWDKKITTKNEFGNQERFLTAPLVADGKVLVQNGAGDGGTRGWVAALDVKDGKELWRWYTVPKPGDPGSESWKDDHNAWKTGGGGIWQTGSYDAAQNLYIVGTGNPFPIYDPQFRPGDNLYTNSVVALDVATGKMAWYFQFTPNDSWDYDETGAYLLYDTVINKQPRKVVGHFGRNGFFYSIDRTNGRFIKAEKYVNDLNWTKGINPRPVSLTSTARGSTCRSTTPSARAARRRQEAHLPDVARRRGTPAAGVQPDQEHRLRRRHRRLFHPEWRGRGGARQGRRRGQQGQPAPAVRERPVLRRAHRVRRRGAQGDRQGRHRHRDPLGRHRHGRRPGVHRAAGRLGGGVQRRNARGTLALQRGHAAQGRAGDLRDRAEAVSGGAGRRAPSAPGELGQTRKQQLPVRLCVELGAKTNRCRFRA